MHFPQNLWPHAELASVSVQGSEQIGQLKSSSIIDLRDERMRKVVFFAVILLDCFFVMYRTVVGEVTETDIGTDTCN